MSPLPLSPAEVREALLNSDPCGIINTGNECCRISGAQLIARVGPQLLNPLQWWWQGVGHAEDADADERSSEVKLVSPSPIDFCQARGPL